MTLIKKSTAFFCLLFLNTMYSQTEVVCFGTTRTYSVDTADGANGTPGSTYTWTIKNADISVNNTPVVTTTTPSGNVISINWGATPVGNYSLEVVENNTSCSGSASTLNVTIKANPTLNTANVAVCLNSNTTITATATPAAGSNSFSWTTPAAFTGTITTNTVSITTATAAMAGNYNVKVTDTDGCEATATAILTVNTLPDATVTANLATEFCNGGSVVLQAQAGLSYVWNKDGALISPSATSVTYTATQAGNYTVTTTDANSCSSTTATAIVVAVNPNPTVTITPDKTEFCNGSNAVLTATTSSGTGPYNFQWMNTSGDIASATSSTYTATTSSDYHVKVTDSKGCTVISVIQNISNRPNPDAIITADSPTTFCAGDNVVLKRVNADTSGFTYQWLKDAVDITTATNFNYTATETGSYTVKVVDTNYTTNCATTTTTPISVTQTALPTTSGITAH